MGSTKKKAKRTIEGARQAVIVSSMASSAIEGVPLPNHPVRCVSCLLIRSSMMFYESKRTGLVQECLQCRMRRFIGGEIQHRPVARVVNEAFTGLRGFRKLVETIANHHEFHHLQEIKSMIRSFATYVPTGPPQPGRPAAPVFGVYPDINNGTVKQMASNPAIKAPGQAVIGPAPGGNAQMKEEEHYVNNINQRSSLPGPWRPIDPGFIGPRSLEVGLKTAQQMALDRWAIVCTGPGAPARSAAHVPFGSSAPAHHPTQVEEQTPKNNAKVSKAVKKGIENWKTFAAKRKAAIKNKSSDRRQPTPLEEPFTQYTGPSPFLHVVGSTALRINEMCNAFTEAYKVNQAATSALVEETKLGERMLWSNELKDLLYGIVEQSKHIAEQDKRKKDFLAKVVP